MENQLLEPTSPTPILIRVLMLLFIGAALLMVLAAIAAWFLGYLIEPVDLGPRLIADPVLAAIESVSVGRQGFTPFV